MKGGARRRSPESQVTGTEVGSKVESILGAGTIYSGRGLEFSASGSRAESCLKIAEVPGLRDAGTPWQRLSEVKPGVEARRQIWGTSERRAEVGK